LVLDDERPIVVDDLRVDVDVVLADALLSLKDFDVQSQYVLEVGRPFSLDFVR
jgi:hypothetical protein